MIKITEPIQVDVHHCYTNLYTIDGFTLIENDGSSTTFDSYPQMAEFLGLSKQGLYNKIRTNMKPLDKLMDSIKNNSK